MHAGIGVFVRRGAMVAALLMIGALTGAQAASAATVPPSDFTCGITVFTPCNQTAHFTDFFMVGSPFPGASSCPAFVTTDSVTIVGTGNGVEHSIVNNAGDGWFTTTFTGTVTITAYTDAGLTTLDPNVLPFTGRVTTWFGGSFNKSNQVLHGTINFSGVAADGTTLTIHDVFHANTTPNTLLGPPHFFQITTC
jgi:hypothetical protein